MPAPQPALRSIGAHLHPFGETCPTCGQAIPNEKAEEIRARAAAMEERLTAEANARASQKLAAERAQIEEAANAKIERAEQEKAQAIATANAEAAAKVEAAKLEGQQSAEAAYAGQIAIAMKARAEAETLAQQKVLAAEQAADARGEEARKQVEVANSEKAEALAKVKEVEAERDTVVEGRVREVREAMEKEKANALAAQKSADDAKTLKLLAEVDSLKRQLEQRRADELGEGAHIQLLDALKAEFPGDDIRRISPGVSGADILHTVMRNGVASGTILWESKNSTAWRDEWVTKLIRDQTAAHADHAVLSTFKLPGGTSQVAIRDNVVIINPARAVAIAHMIRRHLLHVHTLRLSKAQRMEKMAALYDFVTSQRCALLLGKIESDAAALDDLQVSEKAFHEKHWKNQALRYKSIQKAKADLDVEIGAIIGGTESVG
jgi:hypothetical protein